MSRGIHLVTAALSMALLAGTARAVDTFTQNDVVFDMQSSADLCAARALEAGIPSAAKKRLKAAGKLFKSAADLAGASNYPKCLTKARGAFVQLWPVRKNMRVGSAMYTAGGSLSRAGDELLAAALLLVPATRAADIKSAKDALKKADDARSAQNWIAAAGLFRTAYLKIAKDLP